MDKLFNKRNLIIVVVVILFISLNLYKEKRELKKEIGYQHELLVKETRLLIQNTLEANWDVKEDNRHLLSTMPMQLTNKSRAFASIENEVSKISYLLDNITALQYDLIKNGSLTLEQRVIYKNYLKTVDWILMDYLYEFDHRPYKWYKNFTSDESKAVEILMNRWPNF